MARKVKPAADLYQELGVDRSASEATIKRAFRKRAKKTHPDTGGSSEAFERLKQAALVLTDAGRRAEYDRTGECDEIGPDNSEQTAMGIIASLLAEAINSDLDLCNIDLRGKMLKTLKAMAAEHAKELKNVTRLRKRAEKLLGRFTRKGGDGSTIDPMVRCHAEKLKSVEANKQLLVEHHQRAYAILEDYDFKSDAPLPQAAPPLQSPDESAFNRYAIFGGKSFWNDSGT